MEAASRVKELEPGTLPSLLKDADPEDDDVFIETPPVARTGHFAYALLDLIQRLVHYGFPHTKLKEIALFVVRKTHHTFLQRRALDLLLAIGKTGPEVMTEVENQIGQVSSEGPSVKAVALLWREVKRRAEERFNFRGQLSLVMVDYPDKRQVCPILNLLIDRTMVTLRKILPTESRVLRSHSKNFLFVLCLL